MQHKAWRLPWRGKRVPHAVLDVLRGCNISCRACYNTETPVAPKSVKQVQEELETLMGMRRLSSVCLLGGEITLHPQICELVRMAAQKGLHVELLTNGLDIDRDWLRRLRDAGLTIIYFHIERDQKRPDLPAEHTSQDLNRLRLEKARMARAEGLDVGLTMTAFPGELDAVRDVVRLTLETPEINYLLVTLFRDNSGITSLQGDIVSGFHGTGTPPDETTKQTNVEITDWMRETFGFEPFAYMGSNHDANDPRWLSYLVGTVHSTGDDWFTAYVRASTLEKLAMQMHRLTGRYPMYMEQDSARFKKQLMLNGWLGGRRAANSELLQRANQPDARLFAKRLLFQCPAELTADGDVTHCRWCPDAVLKNGTLVPVCIADHVS